MNPFVVRMLMVLLALSSASAVAQTQGDRSAAVSPAPAPQGFIDLLEVDPRGGKVIRPTEFDLTKPGAAFEHADAWRVPLVTYEQTYSDYGSYKLVVNVPEPNPEPPHRTTGRQERRTAHTVAVKPNRHYIVSVLVKTDFDRLNCEANVYLRPIHAQGGGLTPRQTLGLPAVTEGPDGWQRLEWLITTPTDPRIDETKAARLAIDCMARHGDRPPQIRIADFALIELPAKPLEPLARGEGVTFPGSAGDLPMYVESSQVEGKLIVVETTGARYVFNTDNDTILASQRIEFPRDLAKWESSLPLRGLRIDQQSEDVCVLTNDYLTIGIQRDSLMVISPQHELRMTLTNLLGGDFNRYARHYLYSTDDFGGISVDPYIPVGTGLEPQSELLTDGLSFAELSSYHELQKQFATGRGGRAPWSTDELGSAEPGWQAAWTTVPGTLFTTSVFPPRPFEWEQSFTEGRRLFRTHRDPDPLENPRRQPQVTNWFFWDYIPKTFGHSYSNYYAVPDEEYFHKVVETAHGLGIGVMMYMSSYFTPSRDPEVYIDGVRQFKEKFNIDGVYSDGVPSVDWMAAYKVMRMLRELFPSGHISIHNSTQQAGWDVAQHKPFLYSYATSVSMAEGVETRTGEQWQYPRYMTAQFRKSNAFGKTLGGFWFTPEGDRMFGEKSDLVTLVYNGRNNSVNRRRYIEVVSQLYELWKQKGDQPFFYDRYYLPTAQQLTGYFIGRTGMPIVTKQRDNDRVTITLETLSPNAVIYYTTDGTRPDERSERYTRPFTIQAGDQVNAVAIAPELDPSAMAVIKSD